MKLFLFFLTIAFSFYCKAGPRVIGNGGDAVVCWASSDTSVRLLDYLEAELIRGYKIDLGNTSQTVDQMVLTGLDRMGQFSDQAANQLREDFKRFYDEAMFLDDIDLEDIPDSQHFIMPEGCQVVQLAIQRPRVSPVEPVFIINNSLWRQMSKVDRAGLIIHELLYRHALKKGAENSILTRYLNSRISSEAKVNESHEDVAKLMEAFGFSTAKAGGVEYKIKSAFYYSNGSIRSVIALSGYEIEFAGKRLQTVNRIIPDDFCPFETREDGQIQSACFEPTQFTFNGVELTVRQAALHDDGSIKAVRVAEPSSFNIYGQNLTIKDALFLYSSGVVHFASFAKDNNYRFTTQGKTLECIRQAHFHENGRVQTCITYDAVKLRTDKGKKVKCSEGKVNCLIFDPNGALVDWSSNCRQTWL